MKLHAPENLAGCKAKCPKCGATVEVFLPTMTVQNPSVTMAVPPPVKRAEPPILPSNLQPPPPPVVQGHDFDFTSSTPHPSSVGKAIFNRNTVSQNLYDSQSILIAAWIAGAGLLLLGLSPLFRWINFATGGLIGLSGDGKILLGITILAMSVYITAVIKQKWLMPVILSVQAWGTLTVFWMGALIWKVGSILNSSEIKDNPFAALFASQISPGAGLYLGLIGGIIVAGALGFVAVCHLITSGKFKPYYVTQGLSCILGILLAFFVNPGPPSKHETTQSTVASVKNENHFPQQEVFGKNATNPSHLKQPLEPAWTTPEKAVRQGDLQVRIIKVVIGKVPLKDIFSDGGISQNNLLMVNLELTNMNQQKKVEYQSWSGKDISFERDYATLKDNFGNNYKRINFGVSTIPVGAIERSESIYPNKTVSDVLVFEVPLDTATYLELELPCENYNGEGMVRFRIPIKSVSRVSE
ncbi:MAG: hypothetical protein JXB10_08210 [Pirellulales bacterium]|nr:hypothetical protein [Pirellulales bacterium]